LYIVSIQLSSFSSGHFQSRLSKYHLALSLASFSIQQHIVIDVIQHIAIQLVGSSAQASCLSSAYCHSAGRFLCTSQLSVFSILLFSWSVPRHKPAVCLRHIAIHLVGFSAQASCLSSAYCHLAGWFLGTSQLSVFSMSS
jgi:hypothetical protein